GTRAVIARPVVDAVIAAIQRNMIDAMIVDPFIKSHRIVENDNVAMDAVATQWAQIADVTGCSADVVQHTRKTSGQEITIEDGRGAVALISASRSARVLNRMTKDEADNAAVGAPNAWRYFRVDNGKASMAPHPEQADWYRLASVDLGNGDQVGVVTAWAWPD